MADRPHVYRRRFQVTIIGCILLVGAVAAIGGMIAVGRIDDRVPGPDEVDPGRVLHGTQQLQFHLTQAIEEGFAYLASGEVHERDEFFAWAQEFPAEVAKLERLPRDSPSGHQGETPLLERLSLDQQELVSSARQLFAEFERTGALDLDAFHAYEEVVDRIIGDAQALSDRGQARVESDRAELLGILSDAGTIVRRSAALSALAAMIVAIFVLRVLSRERRLREKAERIRRLSERNYLDLYDHSPDMYVSVDPVGSTVVECNQTTAAALGLDKSEIVGKSILDFYDPASRESARGCLETLPATGFASADRLRIVTATGEKMDVSLRVTADRDGQGRIVRCRSVWRDIGSQIEAEHALIAGEARFRSLVESAPICIHEVDLDGNLIDMNAAGLAMLGQSDPAAIRGVPFLDFLQASDHDRISGLMQRAIAGESVEFEFSPRALVREFRSSLVPISDYEGNVVCLMGVTQDLTEHRASERALRQKQKLEAVGRLAGGIAHDFNNLLTVISGYCEELEASLVAGSSESRAVAQVSMAAAQAAALTSQLLAFSRNQKRRPRVLTLNEVVEGLGEMLSRLIGEDVTLDIRLGDDPGSIEADPGQIEQVLMNLAANARDAMPSGGVLTIETDSVDAGTRARLIVTDTGQGIKPEIRERIFEPFYSTKETGRGSGLGLATVLGIVQQNDGEIRIDSEVDRGTRVVIEFPCVVGVGSVPSTRASRCKPGTSQVTETVLLAEDQEQVRELTRQALEGRGYVVLEATDGEDALRVASNFDGTIDLLLTDVVMPRMGGAELGEKLRKLVPGVKIVYVSGYIGSGFRGAIPEGATLIAKPYLLKDLLATLRTILDDVGARVC